MTQDWEQALPTPDVLSKDKVFLIQSADQIALINIGWTFEQILARIMQRYWADELPLFTLRAPKYHRSDPDANIRQIPDYVIARNDPFGPDDIGECLVVNKCERFDWPRERLLRLLEGCEFSFIDRGFQPDLAGFEAIARMAPVRAYGPEFECLMDLRTYAVSLAAWCEREGLVSPPEGKAEGALEPKSYNSGAPGRPTSIHLVAADLARRVDGGQTWGSKQSCAVDLAAWLRDAHPDAQRLTVKTILNRFQPKIPIARN